MSLWAFLLVIVSIVHIYIHIHTYTYSVKRYFRENINLQPVFLWLKQKLTIPSKTQITEVLPVDLSPRLRHSWREWSINCFQVDRLSSCQAYRSCSTLSSPWSSASLHAIVCKGNRVNKCRWIIVNPSCL